MSLLATRVFMVSMVTVRVPARQASMHHVPKISVERNLHCSIRVLITDRQRSGVDDK